MANDTMLAEDTQPTVLDPAAPDVAPVADTDEHPDAAVEQPDSPPADKATSTPQKAVDWEKRYKDEQATLTKLGQENAELRGRLDQLSQQVTAAVAQPKRQERTEKDWLEDDALANKWIENPAEGIREAVRRTRAELATVLEQRDAYWQAKLVEQSPDRHEVKDTIDKLEREKPWFRELSAEAQVNVARELRDIGRSQTTPELDTAIPQPRGAPAGNVARRATQPRKEGEYTPEQKAYLEMVRPRERKYSLLET